MFRSSSRKFGEFGSLWRRCPDKLLKYQHQWIRATEKTEWRDRENSRSPIGICTVISDILEKSSTPKIFFSVIGKQVMHENRKKRLMNITHGKEMIKLMPKQSPWICWKWQLSDMVNVNALKSHYVQKKIIPKRKINK